jgi:hypothetical protein
MYQVLVHITPTFPVALAFLSNGQIGFVKVGTFAAVFDQVENYVDGIEARFFFDCFELLKAGEVLGEYKYNRGYAYKTEPGMLQWLLQQRLEMPKFE